MVVVLVALGVTAVAAADEEAPPEPDPAEVRASALAAAPFDTLERSLPQTSMEGYLAAARSGDYEKAAEFLDLRLPRARRKEVGTVGPRLARELYVVLNQTLWVELGQLSLEPRGRRDDGLPPEQERVGRIESESGVVDVLLQRVRSEDGTPIWKVSHKTLAKVPDLYREFGYGPLAEYLPPIFFDWAMFDVQLWQWTGILALVVAAWALAWIVTAAAGSVFARLAGRTETDLDDRILALAVPPLRLLAAVGLFSLGANFLRLAVPVRQTLAALEQTFVFFGIAWFALRVVDVVADLIERALVRRNQAGATSLVAPGRKTVKTIVFGIAAIGALDSFGFEVTALVAGLGVGGIAFALAAQKTIENLFGGITLFVDRPVRVGDFCRFGDKVGTVEEIGLRSTRIRTLDRTVVSVPNSEFASLQLENFAPRDRFRFAPTLGLRYETTPDQIRYILVEVRRLLHSHERVYRDGPRVRFTNFGASSLDLEIFCYLLARDYAEYLEVAEDLNLRLMDIVAEAGSSFAFPSQTLYVEPGETLDGERVRAAEAQVSAWRGEEALPLPGFPADEVSRMSGSVGYPAEGTTGRRRR